VKEERSSFLKKRTKKLLQIARCDGVKWGGSVPPETDKSFLVLFFKKELLSFFAAAAPAQKGCAVPQAG
jgi:hypothetical protein